MIGMLILICHTSTPHSIISETFGPSRIHIPKAPSLGLILQRPHFDGYNHRVINQNEMIERTFKAGKISEKEKADGTKGAIEFGDIEDEVERFKKEHIWPKMWEEEKRESTFANWINLLDLFNGPDLLYLNRKGIIPSAAIFKAGSPKTNKKIDQSFTELKPPSNARDAGTGGTQGVEHSISLSDDEEDLKNTEEMEG